MEGSKLPEGWVPGHPLPERVPGDSQVEMRTPAGPSVPAVETFPCEACGRTFTSLLGLGIHRARAHGKKGSRRSTRQPRQRRTISPSKTAVQRVVNASTRLEKAEQEYASAREEFDSAIESYMKGLAG